MSTILKRIGAYVIDYLIVYILIYGLLSIPFINPKNNEYQEKYNELINVNEQYLENEISQDEFEDALVPIAYDLYKLNTSYVIVSTICFIGYFGILPYYKKGQTIGKKLFHLKIVSKEDKPLTMVNYILRAIVLFNIIIPILELIVVYTMKVDSYLNVYQNINRVGYVIMYMTIFMVLVRKDGRGLHDFVASTKVIYDETLKSYPIKEKVIEVKETVKKKKSEPSKEKTTKTKTKTTKNTSKKTKPSEK